MSTTVRIRDEDKAKLDRIQAKITLEQGEKPSIEEVLHRLLELGERRQGEVVRPRRTRELTEKEKQEVLGSTFDLGFHDAGGRHRPGPLPGTGGARLSILLDTGLWFGALHDRDEHHEVAQGTLAGRMDGTYGPVYTTSDIVDEAFTVILSRAESKGWGMGDVLGGFMVHGRWPDRGYGPRC